MVVCWGQDRGSWGQYCMNACGAERKAILFGIHMKAIQEKRFTGDDCIPQQILARAIKVLKYMLADGARNLNSDAALMFFHQLQARECGFQVKSLALM